MTVADPAAAPLTVTVCAAAQFAVVNVNAPDTVAVFTSPLAGVTVTDAVGRVAKRTEYSADAPATTSRVWGSTTTPRTRTITSGAPTLFAP